MSGKQIDAVTGAFGYSGKYIAKSLLNKGHNVRTLTNAIHRENPFGDKIEIHPFNFDNPEKLTESLKGVCVLYNTYWVRFNHKTFTFASAVKNTITLFNCAKQAGVERIVHLSVTNPSEESHLEYFRGKAAAEHVAGLDANLRLVLRHLEAFHRLVVLAPYELHLAQLLLDEPVGGVLPDPLAVLPVLEV